MIVRLGSLNFISQSKHKNDFESKFGKQTSEKSER